MAGLDLVDSLVIAENPWYSDTDMGDTSHYIRTKGTGEVSDAQRAQQEEFAQAVDNIDGECSNLDGMARNRCRAMALKDRLS